jgi:hypothetical protein
MSLFHEMGMKNTSVRIKWNGNQPVFDYASFGNKQGYFFLKMLKAR